MLLNPIYYGAFRYKGELHEGVHEPLVSKKLFDQCRKVMSNRSKPKSSGLKPFLYRGLIRCSVCGGLVTSETSKGHVYLHCTKRMEPCKHEYRPAVREEVITEQITQALERVSMPNEWIDGMLSKLDDEQARFAEAGKRKHQALDASKQQIQDKLHIAEEGWLDGVICKDRYRVIQSDLVAKRQSIDEEMASVERLSVNRLESMRRFIKASKQAQKLTSGGTPEQKRDFFKKVGSNPQLVSRVLVFEARDPWQHVEKSTVLVNKPASADAEAGRVSENSFGFSKSGESGIRTHGRPRPTPVFKTGRAGYSKIECKRTYGLPAN